ncbi:hypothetical protein ElyMa_000211800 [Elysia marginata]|uniref:Uncharacterized protein n=1 Tax=Elysia marginata TaxID=1093978 RepID=A0AAV4EYI7_9GAST|nr:hypothetical protein ElyMa_000211800 [Elysia marginata]
MIRVTSDINYRNRHEATGNPVLSDSNRLTGTVLCNSSLSTTHPLPFAQLYTPRAIWKSSLTEDKPVYNDTDETYSTFITVTPTIELGKLLSGGMGFSSLCVSPCLISSEHRGSSLSSALLCSEISWFVALLLMTWCNSQPWFDYLNRIFIF